MYKAGIIGCGKVGSKFDEDPKRKIISSHAGAYSAIDDIDLVAASDLKKENLEKCGKKWKIKSLYKNYKEMLKKENLDIISICTWNSTHLEIVKEAVKNGIKAIFCEKPIADTLHAATQIIEICNKNNIILQIDHQRRFCRFHQEVRNFLNSGKLGKIQQVSFYYTAGIANTGSHMFDLLRFFFGDVKWVIANKSKNISPNEKDPNFDGILKFQNGIFCVIQACDVRNFLIFDIDIYGSKGRIRITRNGFDCEYYNIKESKLFSGYKELFISDLPFKNYSRNFMVNAVEHLLQCLKNKTRSISNGEDGLKALELISAFHISAIENGEKVYLPLEDNSIQITSG